MTGSLQEVVPVPTSIGLSRTRRRTNGDSTPALPDGRVQTAGDDELGYYQPLMVSEMCTQCHGPVADLQPGVRERLDELYPEHQAVGYAPGDLRGLIRMVVPREILERG